MEDYKNILQNNIFSSLNKNILKKIFQEGEIVTYKTGKIIYSAETSDKIGLILKGLFRVFIYSANGRQLTIRYAQEGELLGIVSSIKTGTDVGVQSLETSTILIFSIKTLKSISIQYPELAWKIAEECSTRVYDLIKEFHRLAFRNVRQRLAFHLLSISKSNSIKPYLSIGISQQDLADASGSVREVIVRELRHFKKQGFIQSKGKQIEILNPKALLEESKVDIE
ncbi:MAG TPA: Crp/Fnr family transcriptional regulator [Leptospiraceae bacterium]|nr:Crp/Fnr family transcriptional regulator [Leptospiraceae bacterium]HMW04166.1 Crp/Fnr family transcriptional regulator [Leptospiraceae bacterium]HMX34669.1 Crp/Fnr family transcriptional regulator [Leptospiraceae bacterium]HMY30159.1 Crp/Fnr family transcriptional regulator [Leptospiraceae bacterium]HMZ67216.1 Crp/Fnr family transcriptional regulator [Leptospiraceae bacterium]